MYRWLAIAVVALALSATTFWAFSGGGSGGTKPAGLRLEEEEGITVVRVSGPPRAKGRAHGSALGERIRAELERALPEAGLRDFAVRTCAERLKGFLPDAYLEEVSGIAEGAGITFEEALFLNTRYEIAAFGLSKDEDDLPIEGAVGPGPEAGCLFAEGSARDLVVLVHEDREPPLVLVTRPGMVGGFLGFSGNVAAAMRPIRVETEPTLHGLVWTLLLRRLLEAPPAGRYEPPGEMTGPLSVAMALPDGTVGTLNLAAWGAAWYDASGPRSITTDELPRDEGRRGALARFGRDPGERARIDAGAAQLLQGPPPAGRTLVSLLGSSGLVLAVVDRGGRRVVRLLPE